MTIETKSVLDSKFIFHNYPYIQLLQQYSEKQYSGFYELVQEIERVLEKGLNSQQLDYLRYPDSSSLLSVEEEQEIVYMYETPESEDLDYYKLARLTTYYPNSYTEKPNGIILLDGSYLQIDFMFAHHLQTYQMYLMFFSLHYGRCDSEKKEFYFFRFDKESDYMIHERNALKYMNYKPVYHFHGNCDDPHFPLKPFKWEEKLEYVVRVLAVNLDRIQQKTGESIF